MSTVPWLTIVGAVPLAGALVVAALPRDSAPDDELALAPAYALTAPSAEIEAELDAKMAEYDAGNGDLLPDDLPDRRPAQDLLAKQVTLAVSLVTLVVAIIMSAQFKTNQHFQFVQTYDWIKDFGVHYSVGVDGIGLALIDLTAILMPVVVLAAWGEDELGGRSIRGYLALLLAVEGFLIGSFASTDLFLFYVFFEVMLIPMYFVIGSYGASAASGARRSYAAVKFLLYNLFGGLLMLASVIGLYVFAGHSFLFGDLADHGAPCPAASRTSCSSASSSRSPSRRRCGRSTPGCRTPPPRSPPPARS